MSIQIAGPRLSPMRSSGVTDAPVSRSVVDRIVDSTVLSANYLASGLAGGAAGVGAGARSLPGAAVRTAVSAYTNLWKAETIGPNLKVVGSLVAAPVLALAAGLALPVSLISGVLHGVRAVDSSKPREFTVSAAAAAGYGETRASWKDGEKDLTDDFSRFGNKKLGPNEKPYDIPVGRLPRAAAAAVGGAALGVGVGCVSAVVSGAREAGNGVRRAVTAPDLGIAGKAVAAVDAVGGGVVQGVTYGVSGAFSVLGKGVSETWRRESLLEGGRAAWARATDLVSAAVDPQGTLVCDVPTPAGNPPSAQP